MATLLQAHHSITLGNGTFTSGKEELFFYFEASWRKVPVLVTMQASRYTYADGQWSDWRIWSNDARVKTEGANGFRGDPVTELARRRLSDELAPGVEEWLANEANYIPSRAAAYGRAVGNVARDLTVYGKSTSLRGALTTHRAELTPEDFDRYTRAADAYDVFASIVNDAS